MDRFRRVIGLLFLWALSTGSASAVSRDVIRGLREDFAGHTYKLRLDLRGTNYLVEPNILDQGGMRYRGRDLGILFPQMEDVYLDRISSAGKKALTLTLYRSEADAHQIRGAIPAVPLPVGPDRNATVGNFARSLSTNALLEVQAEKSDPAGQREQFVALLDRLFYLKGGASYEEKEKFILTHPDLPLSKLMKMTGLAEEVVSGILRKREGG